MANRKSTTPGRPKKRPRVRNNAGRKPAVITEASRSTIRLRAIELSNNNRYNKIEVLKLAMKILEKRLNDEPDENETMELDNLDCEDTEHQEIKKHTRESALALALELKLSKNAYVELVRDTKNRGCPLFPCWNTLGITKEECRPNCYNISEVYLKI